MPIILIVEKSGDIKQLAVKVYEESKLFTKAGFKSPENFKCHHTWQTEVNDKQYNVSLYGKTLGIAKSENKYDFPPPADNLLFFSNCVLVNKDANGEAVNLTCEEWNDIYSKLFGGFFNLNEHQEDSEEEVNTEDELENIKTKTGKMPEMTKSGYAKDDFVVDSDEETEEPVSKRKSAPKRSSNEKAAKKKSKKNEPVVEQQAEDEYVGVTNELEEEPYV